MATVALNLQVPNAAQLVALYNRVIVYRSVTGTSGTFEEITNPATRPVLTATQTVYPFTDLDGAATYAYAAGYYNDDTQSLSPIGPPVQGQGDPASGVLSVQELKDQYLFGLDMLGPDGQPIPDATFATWIARALAAFQKKTGLTIAPTIVTGELHDLARPERPGAPPRLQTYKVPVQRITGLTLTLPLMQPTPLPLTWPTLQPNTGRITIYPRSNLAIAQSILGGAPWRFMLYDQPYLPNAWTVDYVAGYPYGQVPSDIADVIGKMASTEPLRVAGDIVGGVGRSGNSLGIDGLSQSVSLVRSGQGGIFASRLAAYNDDITQQLKSLRYMYRGIHYGRA